jgi:hypothetical protein
MHAHVGDWLVVPEVPGGPHARRGLIVAVPHADGSPLFRVRWLDDEHETLLFPPPDARLQRHAAAPGTADATPLPSRSSSSRRPGERVVGPAGDGRAALDATSSGNEAGRRPIRSPR